jgi:hypothetical protein
MLCLLINGISSSFSKKKKKPARKDPLLRPHAQHTPPTVKALGAINDTSRAIIGHQGA